MDITYGPGGYPPEIPGGNVVETVVDHGDGTGTVHHLRRARQRDVGRGFHRPADPRTSTG